MGFDLYVCWRVTEFRALSFWVWHTCTFTFLSEHGGQEHHVSALSIVVFSPFRIVFGTLYPAYSSYKAVKSRDLKEYVSPLLYLADENDTLWRWVRLCLPLTPQVKWMMYWIIFALFSTVEVFTDMFLCWWVQLFSPLYCFYFCTKNSCFPIGAVIFLSSFLCRLPFYYELKIAFIVWLLSPYTKGSSVLYRKFVHPTLSSKEKVKSSPLSVRQLTPTAIQFIELTTFAPLFVSWRRWMQLEPPGERDRPGSCSLFDPRQILMCLQGRQEMSCRSSRFAFLFEGGKHINEPATADGSKSS